MECLNFENKGKSMIENFLNFAKYTVKKDNQTTDNIIEYYGSLNVLKQIKNILYISQKTSEIKKEISIIHFL